MNLDNKVLLKRIAQGGFDHFYYSSSGALLLSWGYYTNPLEMGGAGTKQTNNRHNLLNAFIKQNKGISTYVFKLGVNYHKRFLFISGLQEHERNLVDILNAANVEAVFTEDHIAEVQHIYEESAIDLLSRIFKQVTPTGELVINKDKPKADEIIPWSLYKETYTNEEVQEILNQFKEEMVETTNQLMKRLINRISK